MGAGRSGTTVLASILSEVEGFASAGELRWLWKRGVSEQRPCGCGEIPERCPVWSPVIAQTLSLSAAGQAPWTLQEIIRSQEEIASTRNRIRVLRSARGGHSDWEELSRVRAVTRSACQALADVTESRVVIDTSKRPHDAAVIAALDDVEHYVLHVIRDPRAVVHSWRRAKTFSVAGETRTMGTRRLPSTVRRWIASCLGAELLRRQLPVSRWLRLRYEDFSQDPRTAVDQILRLLGEHGRTPFENDDTVLLHPNHIVAGNPSRFTIGSVKIQADEEWRSQMTRRDQRLVELATKPLMRRYGYAH
ncbi:MAG: sulfotransferase [Nocardioidaceae bacterium]